MRKLATIRKISQIKPIPEADAIELAIVDGWQVVVKKGEFTAGELAVYLEIDSWIPTEVAPFLTKPGHEPKEFEGIKGERLRTIKLRGALSQGLLLPLAVLGEPHEIFPINEGCIGSDVTEQLGIMKWEKPIPAQLRGQVRGNFPTAIPKTDQERIQNLSRDLDKIKKGVYQITEKLHGSSCTFYLDKDNEFHVCSRNLDLKFDENNAYWKAAIKFDVERKMKDCNLQGIAIQGELIGEGINGNQYQVDLDFCVFDVFSENLGTYLPPSVTSQLAHELMLNHVPIINSYYIIGPEASVDSLLAGAEGKSMLNGSEREGLVFKDTETAFSFKVVSNKWLLKTGE